jgi:hypothetical protein
MTLKSVNATEFPVEYWQQNNPIWHLVCQSKTIMDYTCQHCGGPIVGNAYRVTSEDQGVTLLDMVVCSLCFEEAKRLHLHAEEVDIRSKQTSARNRRVHQQRRDN